MGVEIDVAGRSVASRVASILRTFTRGEEHSMTEIALLAELPRSTAHRLLQELAGEGVVDRTGRGTYRAGRILRAMGGADPVGVDVVFDRGRWMVADLVAVTGRRVRLGVLDGTQVRYGEQRPGGPIAAAHPSLATVPSYCTAMGRALLAYSGPQVVCDVLSAGLRAFTEHTVTVPGEFQQALKVVRRAQVAVTCREFESSMCGVAVPVFSPTGAVVAALEVGLPDLDPEVGTAVAALAIAARGLSRDLGVYGRGGVGETDFQVTRGVTPPRWRWSVSDDDGERAGVVTRPAM